ncbi:type III-B CRISPR-associated protein Cas10/Cmr2 [Thiorhodococcus minor]|uniref:Type III-B CRISPR-associated protein Cas10/Cmr2 n=1 Tax=Thiorhodococcus minor TaxID=57489 RepID=A0A6M0K4T0_9GAMM|nr:type III-B CRISPR-associated protein Cas10/Cmr2 [Thiorhodococcus minor]NEV64429.1 type III-B CRISPR-associated protein Cas10/Cmr2 [Thiorhodococcus minor]
MTDWKQKLAAWVHDPAEKSLILMRTREGHEQGTSRILRERLGIDAATLDKRADWLASAADRPNWPRPEHARYPAWERVSFTAEPSLIHPLSGDRIDLRPLATDIAPDEAKTLSTDHFSRLIFEGDAYRTFLAFWRFGPEGRLVKDLGPLWQLMPADSRVPDHSIWAHLDSVSALASALSGGERPALLAMSFGPVQGFIAQARSTSDLWAGSHLLSTIVWEAIRSIAEAVGPDAVLFPSLRGVPAVDAWLASDAVLGERGRELLQEIRSDVCTDASDTNPLFAAALPNKLMAIVPESRVRALAEQAAANARLRARAIAERAARAVLEQSGAIEPEASLPQAVEAQIAAQMAEFPEVQWSAAIWPITDDVRDLGSAAGQLQQALGAIHPGLRKQGIFQDDIWRVLSRELELDGFEFWRPNAGVLYPAVFELAERSLAAAKTARPFQQLTQVGHRCTQCGEREWLTDDRAQLELNRTDRNAVSLWGKLAGKRRSWAKDGEHLCAVCTAKRLWPTLFATEVAAGLVGKDVDKVSRFVVSTHALAVSTAIEGAIERAQTRPEATVALGNLNSAIASLGPRLESATLPKRIMPQLHQHPGLLAVAKRLPDLFEQLREEPDPGEPLAGTDIRQGDIERWVKDLFGARPETYYALIQMDGDRMGAWLAGNEDAYKLPYRDTWHPRIQAKVGEFARRDDALAAYARTKRPPSPARHAAISRALNDFSIHLARHVVEDCVKGKLIYAGGDDVLALVAVDDLFDAMQLLRLAYSGLEVPESLGLSERIGRLGPEGQRRGSNRLWLKQGFGMLDGRLMTLMGHKATASMGAVVAHHTAPLGMVLRELRTAEGHAKQAGRDRFCLRILKRGGGEVSVTSPWWAVTEKGRPIMERPRSDSDQTPCDFTALGLMSRLRSELAQTDFSRAAIYRAQQWLEGVTDARSNADGPRWREQVAGALAYQFRRQGGTGQFAPELVDFVCDVICPEHPRATLENLLVGAEFFARESRSARPVRQGEPS